MKQDASAFAVGFVFGVVLIALSFLVAGGGHGDALAMLLPQFAPLMLLGFVFSAFVMLSALSLPVYWGVLGVITARARSSARAARVARGLLYFQLATSLLLFGYGAYGGNLRWFIDPRTRAAEILFYGIYALGLGGFFFSLSRSGREAGSKQERAAQ